MRAFVVALALGLTGVDVASAACTALTDFTAIVGVEGNGAGTNKLACTSTTLAANTKCDLKATAGYTVSGSLEASCGVGITKVQATPKVTGCAAGHWQGTDATTAGGEASGTATTTTCAECADGKNIPAALFVIAATTEITAASCTSCAVTTDLNAMVGIEFAATNTVAGGPNKCTAAVVGSGQDCDFVATAGYTISGTTKHTCSADAGTYVNALTKVTGCAAGYWQDAGATTAGGEASGTATVGTCTACATGKTIAAALFVVDASGITAASCTDCPTTTMGTAGTCAIGCPADSYQSNALATPAVDTTLLSIECSACDPTVYKGLGTSSIVAAGIETQSTTTCGAKGCRTNYYQVSGSSTVTASCDETAVKAATCVAIDAVDEARCNAITPDPVTATLCEAVLQKATADPWADVAGAKACTYTAAVTRTTLAALTPTVADPTCSAAVGPTATTCAAKTGCTFTAAIGPAAAVDVTDAVCAKCAAGKIIAAADVGPAATVCSGCNPYVVGECANGCPANFWQSVGTTAATIQCTACESGKVLANDAPLAAVQTAAACTVPTVAAASSAVSATASVATAVAAALAAAAALA